MNKVPLKLTLQFLQDKAACSDGVAALITVLHEQMWFHKDEHEQIPLEIVVPHISLGYLRWLVDANDKGYYMAFTNYVIAETGWSGYDDGLLTAWHVIAGYNRETKEMRETYNNFFLQFFTNAE